MIKCSTWMNLENMLSKISQTQKDKYYQILIYDSTYMKYLEWVNLQRQKVDKKRGGRQKEELLLNEYKVSVWGDEKSFGKSGYGSYGIINTWSLSLFVVTKQTKPLDCPE